MFGVIFMGSALYLVKRGNKLTPDWVARIRLLPLLAYQFFSYPKDRRYPLEKVVITASCIWAQVCDCFWILVHCSLMVHDCYTH